ncbi:MAG: cob(I)yrinic acid a,c-diamide adenosyltransferase [Bacteroidota bacterium]|nr:cob(I)yrinic acid a,c-diamide adenosyltransferase [Bacteroidota bacterium]
MKIYTKKGDAGNTQLLGGKVIKKNNCRLECYGTIDELNAFIGHISDHNIPKENDALLLKIQHQLFNMASVIAFDGSKKINLVDVTNSDITVLEDEIDRMELELPALKNFVLPSGNKTSSLIHIARTVCRRAERKLVALGSKEEIKPIHLKYLNRLSDYLFVLARTVLFQKGGSETIWEKNF